MIKLLSLKKKKKGYFYILAETQATKNKGCFLLFIEALQIAPWQVYRKG